jgi:taurine dioxygenase
MGIELRPLSPAIGAEVIGIDVANDVDDVVFEEILSAWHEHLVLLFRGQELSTEEQMVFARRFGELERVRTNPEAGETEQVMFVANRVVEGRQGVLPDGEMYFHTDQCYYENPCQATMLYAIEVPTAGGNTLFANAQLAWSELSADLQAQVVGKYALNVYDYEAGATKGTPHVSPDAPRFLHPVVTRHPDTGKPALYVNRLMTAEIEEGDEDGQLLQTLFEHQEQPQFVYEHIWRRGDLVIWDNRATLHARTDFDRTEARILRRLTVKGDRPAAYVPSVLA